MKSITKLKDSNYRVILILSALWIVYSFLFRSFSFSIGLLFSIFYIFVFIFQNLENKFYIILFTLPFAAIFKISSNLPSMLIMLYVIYILDTIVMKNKKIPTIDVVCIIALFVLEILTIILYKSSIENNLAFILNIIFMRICILNFKDINMDNRKEVLTKSIIIFASSMILSIIIATIFPSIPYIILPEKQKLLMTIGRFSGLNGDPNYYSQLVLIAAALIGSSILDEKNEISNKIKILMFLFLVINGFRGVSKSYAITIVILVVLLFFHIYKYIAKESKIAYYKKIALSIFIVVIGLLCVYIFTAYIVEPMIQSRKDSSDLLTGRGQIWKLYLQAILLKPYIIITGVGASNGGSYLVSILGQGDAAHSVYIELLVEVGLVGICICAIMLRDIFFNKKLLVKNVYSIYIYIIGVTSLALSMSSNDALFILLPLIYLSYNFNSKVGCDNEQSS